MYSALIIDDEIASINSLKMLLEKHCPKISTIHTSQNVNDASLIILRKKPNIVFSDIKMPDMNGIDFLKSFNNEKFKSIVVTAYTEFGLMSLQAGVSDYLVKPILSSELIDSVNKIIKDIESESTEKSGEPDTPTDKTQQANNILLKDANGTILVCFDDVVMIQAINNYSILFLANGKKHTSPHTLKWFNDTAPLTHFFRSHKSFLINIKYIEKFTITNDRKIHLANGLLADLAINKSREFKQFLKK